MISAQTLPRLSRGKTGAHFPDHALGKIDQADPVGDQSGLVLAYRFSTVTLGATAIPFGLRNLASAMHEKRPADAGAGAHREMKRQLSNRNLERPMVVPSMTGITSRRHDAHQRHRQKCRAPHVVPNAVSFLARSVIDHGEN